METFQQRIPTELKQIITSEEAYEYRIIPKEKNNNSIIFWSDAKNSNRLAKELSIIYNSSITINSINSTSLDTLLAKNYRKSTTTKALNFNLNFLEKLLLSAKEYDSSDIHLEPYEKQCRIRFRIDGKLIEQYTINKEEYPQIINQIKIKAGLDISQKRLSQDGRISVNTDGNEFDIRVSCLPTLHGEKIVMRILKRDTKNIDLKKLGFTDQELKTYLEGIKNPNGIILISGPTGSGKTTTLYGTLKLLNEESRNITTIEDPIEYTLEGINQVQLKEDIGFDFPSALRTFLRQDPDIIMVGEIRDEKTANMAIKAALTGHLVFSTIHTNSAWATISRLIDMSIPPFLIASTLKISMAQRLVRKLCPHCKKETCIEKIDFPSQFSIPKEMKTTFEPIGCPQCHYTGYSGRIAIYEILPIDRQMEQFIHSNDLNIDEHTQKHKIKTLKSNAIRLIKSGKTSVEEVYSILTNTI
ncbi:GspE/PulE family protein [Zunongwangia sp.]|uniref:GspE/PulE family protein n=1 Tax=Zunongwangia sp. TaxID=1965325 RepID=UPI003AA99810